MTQVNLIWAQGTNGVIGADGSMPWHLPEDLAYFRSLTEGSTVIMGRNTWESIPAKFRPLPGRRNIVLTSAPDWSQEGSEAFGSLPEALASITTADAWIIGGAKVYQSSISHADRLYVTYINEHFEGDAFAPQIGSQWQEVSRNPGIDWHESKKGLEYAFAVYKSRQ